MKKPALGLIVVIFISIVVFHLQSVWVIREHHEEVMEAIEKRTYLDSLYWNHLEECSFIADDNIKVGWRGALYSKYHKDGKIKQ